MVNQRKVNLEGVSGLREIHPISEFPEVYSLVEDIRVYDPYCDGVPDSFLRFCVSELTHDSSEDNSALIKYFSSIRNRNDNVSFSESDWALLRQGAVSDVLYRCGCYLKDIASRSDVSGRQLDDFLKSEVIGDGKLGLVAVGGGRILGGVDYDRLGRLYFEYLKDRSQDLLSKDIDLISKELGIPVFRYTSDSDAKQMLQQAVVSVMRPSSF